MEHVGRVVGVGGAAGAGTTPGDGERHDELSACWTAASRIRICDMGSSGNAGQTAGG